jgi:hypothetical protein
VPQLLTRLAEHLSFHLSNWELKWPWDKWAGAALTAAPCDARRALCLSLLQRLVRVCYYDNLVQVGRAPRSAWRPLAGGWGAAACCRWGAPYST